MTWLIFLMLQIFLITIGLIVAIVAFKYWQISVVKITSEPSTVVVGTQLSSVPAIPKIIWAYWHDKMTPDLVQRCQKNWQTFASDHEIRLLHKDNFMEWIPATHAMPDYIEALPPFRQADWMRLQLLAIYGGFWIDATIILTKPLDWLHELQQKSRSEYLGFYINLFTNRPTQPIVENWFMAATKSCIFIEDLLQEFKHSMQLGEIAYLNEIRASGRFEQVVQTLDPISQEYLIMHVAAAKLLDANVNKYSLALVRAEDSAFAFHHALHWSKRKLHIKLALTPKPKVIPPLIKLRGNDRRRIEKYLAQGWYLSGSLLGKLLNL